MSREVSDVLIGSTRYRQTDADDAIDLLFRILRQKVEDPELDAVGPDILTGLDRYRTEFDIGNLADRCEPFLKFIARMLDPVAYEKLCRRHDGKATFADLLLYLGLANSRLLQAKSPESLSGAPDFAEHVARTYIARNRVHEAPDYSRAEEALIGRSILVFLVFAVAEHHDGLVAALRCNLAGDDLRQLRDRFAKWQTRFIALDGAEAPPVVLDDLDLMAVELLAADDDIDDDAEEEGEIGVERRRGRVIDLVDQVPRIVLLGDPGAGKTTTLQYMAWHAADRMLSAPGSEVPYPVYVELKFVSRTRSLTHLLMEEAGGSAESVEDLLAGGHLLLLDGWNEVRGECREDVLRDISYLLDERRDVHLVVSSRPGAYDNELQLPCFSLQALTDEQIEAFLCRRFRTEAEGTQFLQLLRATPRLLQWARNPLCLEMLSGVARRTGGSLPENRGQLYQLFLRSLMEREQRQAGLQTPRAVKEHLLSYLAFETRREAKVAFSFDEAVSLLSAAASRLGTQVDLPAFLREVTDNHLLSEPEADRLSFAHEMYQEYFAAYEISIRIPEEPELINGLDGLQWDEPIVLFSGLSEKRNALIRQLSAKRPLLAARSITSSTSEEPRLSRQVASSAHALAMGKGGEDLVDTGLQALVELRDFKALEDAIRNTPVLYRQHKLAIEATVQEGDREVILGLAESLVAADRRNGVTWLCDALRERGQLFEPSQRALRLKHMLQQKGWPAESCTLAWFTGQAKAKDILEALTVDCSYRSLLLADAILTSGEMISIAERQELTERLLTGNLPESEGRKKRRRRDRYGAIALGVRIVEKGDLAYVPAWDRVVTDLLKLPGAAAYRLARRIITQHKQDLQVVAHRIVDSVLEGDGGSYQRRVKNAVMANECLGSPVKLPVSDFVQELLAMGTGPAGRLAADLVVKYGLEGDTSLGAVIDLLMQKQKTGCLRSAVVIAEKHRLASPYAPSDLLRAAVSMRDANGNWFAANSGLIRQLARKYGVLIGKDVASDRNAIATGAFRKNKLADAQDRATITRELAGKTWALRVVFMLDAIMGFARSDEFPDNVFFRVSSLHDAIDLQRGDMIEAEVCVRFNKKRDEWSYAVKTGRVAKAAVPGSKGDIHGTDETLPNATDESGEES